MAREKQFKTATGSAAMSESLTAGPFGMSVESVRLHCDAAPTTSENFQIAVDADAGTAYDTVLLTVDLAAGSTTDLVWIPEVPLAVQEGDVVDVTFTNTDTVTWGLEVVYVN